MQSAAFHHKIIKLVFRKEMDSIERVSGFGALDFGCLRISVLLSRRDPNSWNQVPQPLY